MESSVRQAKFLEAIRKWVGVVTYVTRKLKPTESKRRKIRKLSLPFMHEVNCVDVGAAVYPHPKWNMFRHSQKAEFILIDPDESSLGYASDWKWSSSVRTVVAALWSATTDADLYVTATPTGSSLFEPVIPLSETFRVTDAQRNYFYPLVAKTIRTTTLDEVSVSFRSRPIVLKMDCQGGELEVLKGAQHLLETNPPVLIELEASLLSERFYKGSPALNDVMNFLLPLGYELLDLDVIRRPSSSKNLGKSLPHECDVVFALQPFGERNQPLTVRWMLFLSYVEYGLYDTAGDLLLFDDELRSAFESLSGVDKVSKLLDALTFARSR